MKGMPHWKATIIGSSISLLQRLLRKILAVYNKLSQVCSLKSARRASWVSLPSLNCYLHKVNVPSCSFENFFFSFPCFLQVETRPSLLFSSCLHGIWWDGSSEYGSSLVAPADLGDFVCFPFLGYGPPQIWFVPGLCLSAFECLRRLTDKWQLFKKYSYGPFHGFHHTGKYQRFDFGGSML